MHNIEPKILVATTNKDKLKEIQEYFLHQPFVFTSLREQSYDIVPPEETGTTVEENAMLKATYYGEKTGMLTLSEDTGLFIDGLNGWPGIFVGRERQQEDDQFTHILSKMSTVENRSATFVCVTAVYNPHTKTTFLSRGELRGEIAKNPIPKTADNAWGYNRLFFVTDKQKSFGDMTIEEKNIISHRSASLEQIKHYLHNSVAQKQIVVPIGLIIQNGKILMNVRNDPYHHAFHNKWEFPGGGIQKGETPKQAIIREVKEETGYDVDAVQLLQHIHTEEWERKQGTIRYKLFLMPYVCKIIGGQLQTNPREVLGTKWFDIDDVCNHDLVGTNKEMVNILLPELLTCIRAHNL